jgi:hypothetical protein
VPGPAEAGAVRRKAGNPYLQATAPFVLDGQKQFVEIDDWYQHVRRRRWPSRDALEETVCRVTSCGCAIVEIGASPSGAWLVTQRSSGQGEWGYDVFRTRPLTREAGVTQERGYLLELPRFAADETWLVGGAGPGFLGGWWAHPDDDPESPARGGVVTLGFLLVHRLPSHRVTRHALRVKLPKGWLPEGPTAEAWYGPREIRPTAGGVRLVPSWGAPIEVRFPLPWAIRLPTPAPSGEGLL